MWLLRYTFCLLSWPWFEATLLDWPPSSVPEAIRGLWQMVALFPFVQLGLLSPPPQVKELERLIWAKWEGTWRLKWNVSFLLPGSLSSPWMRETGVDGEEWVDIRMEVHWLGPKDFPGALSFSCEALGWVGYGLNFGALRWLASLSEMQFRNWTMLCHEMRNLLLSDPCHQASKVSLLNTFSK